MKQITRQQVLDILRRRYPEPGFQRQITRLRPYICPFEEIINRLPKVATMYDAGCGTGILCSLANELGISDYILGTDTSSSSIDIARTSNQSSTNLEFRRLSADEWPAKKFDLITCVDVIHHIPPHRQQQFIQNLINRLNMNGSLIIKDISPFPRWKAAANILHDLIMARQLVNLRPESTITSWLTTAGLTIQSKKRLDRLWYGHYLLIARKI